jgi:hypothetical protein
LIADELGGEADQAESAEARAHLAPPGTEETLLLKAERAFAQFVEIKPFWKA